MPAVPRILLMSETSGMPGLLRMPAMNVID